MLRVLARRSLPTASRSVSTTGAAQNSFAGDILTNEGTIPQTHRDVHYPGLGNRDMVGFGLNGIPTYLDDPALPAPACRWKENTEDVLALRKLEKGDWKNLTMEQKKELYRASFCQTYAEMKAPTGEWKSVLAITLGGVAFTGWMLLFLKKFVYGKVPETITDEWKEVCLQRMIDHGQGRIQGVASKYDYENKQWK